MFVFLKLQSVILEIVYTLLKMFRQNNSNAFNQLVSKALRHKLGQSCVCRARLLYHILYNRRYQRLILQRLDLSVIFLSPFPQFHRSHMVISTALYKLLYIGIRFKIIFENLA